MLTFRTAALFAGLAGIAAAQAKGPVALLPQGFALPVVIPVHTAPDDEVGGPYGIWAAGRNYKVSFHDGIAFHPSSVTEAGVVFRWRTARIECGGAPVAAPARLPAMRWTDTRVEIDHGGVVEAYDVLPEGLEQTFTLLAPPAAGDLRIVGAVDGGLQCAPTLAQVGALTFARAAANALVHYGAATVVDASGRKAGIETSYAEGRITLRVDGAWLAGAAYPVVVDPLISDGNVVQGGNRVVGVDLYRDDQETERNLWVTYSQLAGGDDLDLVTVRLAENAPALGGVVVFSDITTGWRSRQGRLAGIGGPGKVVTAFVRGFFVDAQPLPGEHLVVRWHSHDKTDLTLKTHVGGVNHGTGEHDWSPVVGGSTPFALGANALLMFQRERGTQIFFDTFDSDVLATVIDLTASERGVAGPVFPIAAVPGRDEEEPSVNLEAKGGSDVRWLVAWEQVEGSGDDTDAFVGAVQNDGVLLPFRLTTADAADATTDKRDPVIAGSDGRYLLVYRQVDRGGAFDRLRAQRIDWPEGSATGQRVHSPVLLDTETTARLQIAGCAFDTNTRSHWAVQYARIANTGNDQHIQLFHLGFRGRMLDFHSVYRNSSVNSEVRHPGNITFNDDADSFPLVFSTKELGREEVQARRLTKTSVVVESTYGASCSSALIDWDGSQRIGSDLETLRVRGPTVPGSAVFVLGVQPADLDLGAFGMPGCRLLVDVAPASLIGMFVASSTGGSVTLPIPLLEQFPGITVRAQAFYPENGSFVSTRGLTIPLVR